MAQDHFKTPPDPKITHKNQKMTQKSWLGSRWDYFPLYMFGWQIGSPCCHPSLVGLLVLHNGKPCWGVHRQSSLREAPASEPCRHGGWWKHVCAGWWNPSFAGWQVTLSVTNCLSRILVLPSRIGCIIPARPQPGFLGHFKIFINHFGVRRGFKMILSHRAPCSLNMSSYRAIWTHFRPNFIIFGRKKFRSWSKKCEIFLKCKSPHLAILIII